MSWERSCDRFRERRLSIMRHAQWFQVLAPLVALAAWPTMAPASIPDPANSYFVPQAGLDYSNPLEGSAAVTFFHACPNNDGGSSLPQNARIKLVVKDASGAPIAGISAADLCIVFNGGTPAQGYSGAGADSIIAN